MRSRPASPPSIGYALFCMVAAAPAAPADAPAAPADLPMQVLLETAEKGFAQEQLMAIMHQVAARSYTASHAAAPYLILFCPQVELDGLAVSADRGLRLALDVLPLLYTHASASHCDSCAGAAVVAAGGGCCTAAAYGQEHDEGAG